MKQGNRKDLVRKNHLHQKFRKGHHSMIYRSTNLLQLGYCGLHSPGIDWVVALSNLWHGFAAVSMGELGHSTCLSTMAPKTDAEICGTDAEIHGMESNVLFVLNMFWIALLRATCWHWHVAFVPQRFYISHASLDLGCLALSLQIWWQFESKP